MLPQITELEIDIEGQEELPPLGKSFLFDFNTGQFVKKDGKLVEVEGKEAIKVWIEKVIRTEKFRFKVYEDSDFGISIEDLFGSNFPQEFIESELKRELTEELTKHPYIESLSGWEFERKSSLLTVHFRVNLINGDSFEQEVNRNV